MAIIGKSDYGERRDRVIGLVHGAGVIRREVEGSPEYSLHPNSIANLNHAVRLLRQGTNFGTLVLSGGAQSPEELEEAKQYDATEARLMWHQAVAMNVDPNKLLVEQGSTSTVGNWSNTVTMLMDTQRLDPSKPMVDFVGITTRNHKRRAMAIGSRVLPKGVGLTYETSLPIRKEPMTRMPEELGAHMLTRRFFSENPNVPIADMADAYEDFMARDPIARVARARKVTQLAS